MADLALFRPSDFVARRIECHEQIVKGSGLRRGLATLWHTKQVKVVTGKQEYDVQYLGVNEPTIGLWPHVGNIRHLNGKADYIVMETENPWIMGRFREIYGLPAYFRTCGFERYLFYDKEMLDSAKIRDIWEGTEWRDLLLDPDDPGDTAKWWATYGTVSELAPK